MYLVDTNIVSAASPSRHAPAELIAWMDARSASLFLSAVTVAEIEDGITKLRRDGLRERAGMRGWLESVIHLYGERILVFDTLTARVAGALSDRARGRGHAPGFSDIIIAATALHNGLTILSRNTRHFAPLGVPVFNPFVAIPPS